MSMEEWFNLPEAERQTVINQVSAETGFLPAAVEKDWWVMIALRAIFNTEYAEHFVFKGGTSLSKAWGIIERFSEDIDLAIDRSYFGFDGDLSRGQVTNLRKACCKFVVEEFIGKLSTALTEMGVTGFSLNHVEFERSDTDPLAIELHYDSLTEAVDYLLPRILIEISSRSLIHPFENRTMVSLIGGTYPELPYADAPVEIPTVVPARTLLEKIFLLHEEFQKPANRPIRSERMTRHLYDIARLMDTDFLEAALADRELYNTIVAHREMLTKVSWVDYDKHHPKHIQFIPPKAALDDWKKDYAAMQESMFYGESLPFDELLEKLKGLQERINGME